MRIPRKWDAGANTAWLAGDRNGAIQKVIAAVNKRPLPVPRDLSFQLSYYMGLTGDWRSAASVLANVCKAYPNDTEALLNFGVCLGRSNQHEKAIDALQSYVAKGGSDPVCWDTLCRAYAQLGKFDKAKEAGETSLNLKHAASTKNAPSLALPPTAAEIVSSASGKTNVVSFSLWGNQPRYLRGALQNVLRMPKIYPGWVCRFYVDSSVPDEFATVLEDLNCQVMTEANPKRLGERYRLARRFWVANDPSVGYFQVRDCDAVIGEREAAAVRAWMQSDRTFHVMRDWWTHTDLILAGMWGGVAGLLPNLEQALEVYVSHAVETPNVDQWFLRDCVWGLIHQHTLVHDRCFRTCGSVPFPGPPAPENYHVGQNEFAIRRHEQSRALRDWSGKLACLGLDLTC